MSIGLHTIIDFSNFIIKPKNLNATCDNLMAAYKLFALNNNLNVVAQNHKVFDDIGISPYGF